jgi:hypothetical protein
MSRIIIGSKGKDGSTPTEGVAETLSLCTPNLKQVFKTNTTPQISVIWGSYHV